MLYLELYLGRNLLSISSGVRYTARAIFECINGLQKGKQAGGTWKDNDVYGGRLRGETPFKQRGNIQRNKIKKCEETNEQAKIL